VEANLPPFDYILLVTKNCPDIPPSIATLIAPAVTPGTTKLVMIQNGINIEKPLFKAFPKNIVLSGVSMIDAHEKESGTIFHEYHDLLYIGAFHNTSPTAHHSKEIEDEAAREFIEIYNAAGKSTVEFNEDVQWARWRKLVFNATFNPLCAITGLDDGKLRLTDGAVEGLLRPAMNEVVATAKALGYQLPEDVIETMIHCDEIDLYLKPSMQIDSEKVRVSVFIADGQDIRKQELGGTHLIFQ
jgi:2-dehydropantoate 2-reductase